MKAIYTLKYTEIKDGLNQRKWTSEEVAYSFVSRIEKFEPKIKAFLSIEKDFIISQAKESDLRRKSGNQLSEYDGIPIGIKDNICIKGIKTTCASKILENFISPYDATAIEKLKSKGFVLFPRLNMDEFAMGSSTENSAYQITCNPFDISRIPGGSSGGSAAGVAAGFFSNRPWIGYRWLYSSACFIMWYLWFKAYLWESVKVWFGGLCILLRSNWTNF
jgi:aspartyl-tRNA(Asn)/glutamyl-tRNA(Gln) amidotransferase subunit A